MAAASIQFSAITATPSSMTYRVPGFHAADTVYTITTPTPTPLPIQPQMAMLPTIPLHYRDVPNAVPVQSDPSPAHPSPFSEMVNRYSSEFSVDPTLMNRIAKCESGWNTAATNGIYAGLYQFEPGTWRSNRVALNQDPDPELRFNPEESIKTAAYLLSRRGHAPWPVCGR